MHPDLNGNTEANIRGMKWLNSLRDVHLEMAKMLNVEPSKILYVGNSKKYDVAGSHSAGMKCAYLVPFRKRLFKKIIKEPEICFSNYRQLQDIVLQ